MRNGIEVIAPDALPCLRGEWQELWARVPDASPFAHPAWLLPWAEVYAPGRCWAATHRDGGDLNAIVAGFVWDSALRLAGTGPSDHATALIARQSPALADELLAALADGACHSFARIDLQQLPGESPLGGTADGEPCLVLPLAGEDGMARVSKKTRSNWRYSVRRLEREGAVVELVAAEDAADAARDLERLHAMRWREEGEEGVLADDLAARHLRVAIAELARDGLLRMHRLRRGKESVAILFAMRGGRSTCFYLSGFDPAWSKLSPGNALVGAAIARAAAEGCTEFDFLRGKEDYKYRWGATERPTRRRVEPMPARRFAAFSA